MEPTRATRNWPWNWRDSIARNWNRCPRMSEASADAVMEAMVRASGKKPEAYLTRFAYRQEFGRKRCRRRPGSRCGG